MPAWDLTQSLVDARMLAGDPESGIARALAAERGQTVQTLRYDVSLEIPASPSEPVSGNILIEFDATDKARPLVLDFAGRADFLSTVSIGGKPSNYYLAQDHIVIPHKEITLGHNLIRIAFQAGNDSLHRNPDFVYTLFVPARAHRAFPCFDQPDLKARYRLELTISSDWESVSNSAEVSRTMMKDGRMQIRYAETPPISTYLFAFAAGRFEVDFAERTGRKFRMFHRETDADKVARNRDAIFDLHARSLAWMEQYTGIPYPFGKFDFVLIPSFQFTGMEHPGAIFYNASALLLDESAPEDQMLNRANTIAHETAHMWFGNLVTMQWFNDVWMKEVFASFMAAKIVNPAFPNIDSELRFFLSNYPAAYAVDRTAGTHPIRQELNNLDEAGSLYGAIVYQKAPIVMRQLELILGSERFQEGLRDYLKRFEFDNATWLDLINLLDAKTDIDLAGWSRSWIEEAGRPSIRTRLQRNPNAGLQSLALDQTDPQPGRMLLWQQRIQILLGTSGTFRSIPVELFGRQTNVPISETSSPIDVVLPSGGGLGYGNFTLDDLSRAFLLKHLSELRKPVDRAAAWTALWEEMLDGRIQPQDLMNLGLYVLPLENTQQNIQLLLNQMVLAFWKFVSGPARRRLAPALEQALRSGLDRAGSSSMKAAYFVGFCSIVTTPPGVAFLERVWRREHKIPGLTLAEVDEAGMALNLAVRSGEMADAILDEQWKRLKNPDRKARFEFIMPASSSESDRRDGWFQSLTDAKNRRREPWVIQGLRYLNYPLRVAESQKYIRPGLELLEQVQRTGDIFFPKRWLDALLSGHNSQAAAKTVRAFLAEQKDYPAYLRRIIMQSADDLFRAVKILS